MYNVRRPSIFIFVAIICVVTLLYIGLYGGYIARTPSTVDIVTPPTPKRPIKPKNTVPTDPNLLLPAKPSQKPTFDLSTVFQGASPKFRQYFQFKGDGDLTIKVTDQKNAFLNNLCTYFVQLYNQYKKESQDTDVQIMKMIIQEFKTTINDLKEIDLVNGLCDLLVSKITDKTVIDNNAALDYGRRHGIFIWAMDRHISPPEDLKDIVKYIGLNVTFIDRSLSGHCHIPKSCVPADFPWKDRHYDTSKCRLAWRKEFFEKFKNHADMKKVDIVYLTFEVASLELYLPLNKYFLLAPATRYHFGRYDVTGWNHLNWNIQLLAKDPKNVFSGNNDYDSEFLRYYTGVKTETLTALCAYPNVVRVATPTRKQIIVGPSHLRIPDSEWQKVMSFGGLKYPVAALRQLYPHFQYSDLTQHPAIVVIPYQVSTMSIFEYYRMNMPMFFPSKRLLIQLHKTFELIKEISWFTTWSKQVLTKSPIPRHSCSSDLKYDPSVTDPDSPDFLAWLDYSDFYRFPHLILFDSWEDLAKKINTVNLDEISQKMKAENVKIKAKLMGQYTRIFNKMFKGQKERKKIVSQDFNESMLKLWDLDMTKVKNDCDDPIQPSLSCD